MKLILVIISDKRSCLLFHFRKDFVNLLTENKKELALFWSTENKRWEFDTLNLESIQDFLEDAKLNDELEVIVDDRRGSKQDMDDKRVSKQEKQKTDSPDSFLQKKKKKLF